MIYFDLTIIPENSVQREREKEKKERNFLICLKPVSFPTYAKSAMCVCWRIPPVFLQAVYSFALAITFCLHRPSDSARGEKLGPSQGFPGHDSLQMHISL